MSEDTFAHSFDDGRQFIGADMGVCFVEDGVGRAEVMEEFHDALHVTAFLGAGEQFAVREGAGTSFAEAVVGLGVESFVAVEQGDVFLALADLFPAFVDDGFDAMFHEREGGKQTSRAGSDDDGLARSVVHVLEHRRLVEGDRGLFSNGFAVVVGQNSEMHAQLALPCIYTPLDDAPLLFGDIRFAGA